MLHASLIIHAAANGEPGAIETGTSPPMLYWMFWAMLLLTMALLVAFVMEVRQHPGQGHKKPVSEGLVFAGIISALVFGAFIITFSNEFNKYSNYYEPPTISIVRFIMMAVTALLLTYYAIRGRDDH